MNDTDRTLILEMHQIMVETFAVFQKEIEQLKKRQGQEELNRKNKEIARFKRDLEELKTKLSQFEEGDNISQYESEMAQLNHKISTHESEARSIKLNVKK